MSGELVIFFVLGLLVLGGAVFMLSLTKVVHMVVALSLSFLGVAGIFFLLEAEFIAVAQVLIYVGAVTIMMLFGIMLTRHDDHDEARRKGFRFLAFLFVAGFLVVTILVVNTIDWIPAESALAENNTAEIGLQLFAKYVIPFELTSVVLLVALVGAVILARRDDEDEVIESLPNRKIGKEGGAGE